MSVILSLGSRSFYGWCGGRSLGSAFLLSDLCCCRLVSSLNPQRRLQEGAVCEGMGKPAEWWRQSFAEPSAASVCLGAGIGFQRGQSPGAVVWMNLWQSMNILIKISACRLISQAFSQVSEINSRLNRITDCLSLKLAEDQKVDAFSWQKQ